MKKIIVKSAVLVRLVKFHTDRKPEFFQQFLPEREYELEQKPNAVFISGPDPYPWYFIAETDIGNTERIWDEYAESGRIEYIE